MNRLAFSFIALLIPVFVCGQSFDIYGFDFPQEGIISVSFDYSDAELKGIAYGTFCKAYKNFPTEKDDAECRYIEMINDHIRTFSKTFGKESFQFGRGKGAKKRTDLSLYNRMSGIVFLAEDAADNCALHMVVKPLTVTENGDVVADIIIKDGGDKPLAFLSRVSGKGGIYGSFVNLLGDGYENVAKTVAEYLVRAVNKGTI